MFGHRWLSGVLTWRSLELPSPRLARAGGLGRLVDSLSVGARTGRVSAATAAFRCRRAQNLAKKLQNGYNFTLGGPQSACTSRGASRGFPSVYGASAACVCAASKCSLTTRSSPMHRLAPLQKKIPTPEPKFAVVAISHVKGEFRYGSGMVELCLYDFNGPSLAFFGVPHFSVIPPIHTSANSGERC